MRFGPNQVFSAIGVFLSNFVDVLYFHHQRLGRYTCIDKKPSCPPVFWHLLFFPFIPLVYLSSLTLSPILIQGARSLLGVFIYFSNTLGLAWNQKKLPYPTIFDLSMDPGSDDDRTMLQYLYGVPGGVIGFALAIPFSTILIVSRIVLESILTTGRVIVSGLKWILPERYHADRLNPTLAQGLNSTSAKVRRFGFGFPGLLLGSLLSVLVLTPIVLWRGLVNTLHTGYLAMKTAIYFVTKPYIRQTAADLLHNERGDAYSKEEKIKHFVWGGLGVLPGLALGVWFALPVLAFRVLVNTFESGFRAIGTVLKFFVPPSRQAHLTFTLAYSDEMASRVTSADYYKTTYLFGLVGVISGGTIAAALFVPFIVLGRMLYEGAIGFRAVASTLFHAVLPNQVSAYSIRKRLDEYKAARSSSAAAIFYSALGMGLAVLLVSVPVAVIGVFRHSFLSFVNLSKSFLNLLLVKPYFQGLRQDARGAGEKAAGALGYALASVTVIPLVLFLRLGLHIVSHALAFSAAPIVALVKLFKKLHAWRLDKTRFQKNDIQPSFQRLKNLIAALRPSGVLLTEEALPQNASGEKFNAGWNFLRKIFNFGVSSLTEFVLGRYIRALRAHYELNPVAELDLSAHQAIKARCLVEVESSTFHLASLSEAEKLIDAVGEYVLKPEAELANYSFSASRLYPKSPSMREVLMEGDLATGATSSSVVSV